VAVPRNIGDGACATRSCATLTTVCQTHGGFKSISLSQFFEFVGGIAQSTTDGDTVRLSPALVQPIASDDVAAALADIAVEGPLNGTVELAGPDSIRLDELVRRFLEANRDARKVTTDVHARYFGTELNDQSLTPGDNPRIGPTRFEAWLSRSIPRG
jgi:uncharacterized protein YbjT (DUF2867 family)